MEKDPSFCPKLVPQPTANQPTNRPTGSESPINGTQCKSCPHETWRFLYRRVLSFCCSPCSLLRKFVMNSSTIFIRKIKVWVFPLPIKRLDCSLTRLPDTLKHQPCQSAPGAHGAMSASRGFLDRRGRAGRAGRAPRGQSQPSAFSPTRQCGAPRAGREGPWARDLPGAWRRTDPGRGVHRPPEGDIGLPRAGSGPRRGGYMARRASRGSWEDKRASPAVTAGRPELRTEPQSAGGSVRPFSSVGRPGPFKLTALPWFSSGPFFKTGQDGQTRETETFPARCPCW